MRVLWFTNVPLPQAAVAAGRGTAGFGGHWMTELFRAVAGRRDLELAVATAFPGLRDGSFEQDGARWFSIGQATRAATFAGSPAEVGKCAAVVRDFAPDLVHFHGSERFFGLVKTEGLVTTPAVVSLQGVLGPYSEWRNYFGALSALDIAKATRLVEIPLGLGLVRQYQDLRRGARQEARIVAAMEGVLGRTAWDEAWARRLNPRASYHHVGEVLRPAFREARWAAGDHARHSIIYTNAGHPRRGTENLLAAAALLREEFPGLQLRLAGVLSERSGYGRFLRARIRRLGLERHVEFLGYLEGEAMARELARSHLFVISSYVENSPNSLAEAMMVGMPCVASAVGGVPSMVDDGENGLMYPVDDVHMLTAHIRRVFLDDVLAARLGAAARETALVRHDPARVAEQLLAAYRAVLGAGAER